MKLPTVLLTRASGLNHSDQLFFQKLGYQTLIVPLTEIQQLSLNEVARQQLNEAEWLFFSSQAPVSAILEEAKQTVKIAVIGEQTAKAVRQAGFVVDFISPVATKAALVAAWQEKISPTTIFYPKSQLADSYLEEQLSKKHTVYSQVTYKNILPEQAGNDLQQLKMRQAFQAVYLTSPSAWQRFYQVYGQQVQELTLFAIGPTTKKSIEKEGFQVALKPQ